MTYIRFDVSPTIPVIIFIRSDLWVLLLYFWLCSRLYHLYIVHALGCADLLQDRRDKKLGGAGPGFPCEMLRVHLLIHTGGGSFGFCCKRTSPASDQLGLDSQQVIKLLVVSGSYTSMDRKNLGRTLGFRGPIHFGAFDSINNSSG